MGITVRQLLANESLSYLTCLTGESGLDNVIEDITIIENPGTISTLKGGELVLTTGFLFQQTDLFLADIIKQMQSTNCAGLGIKLKRYMDQISPSVIEKAKELNFPIIVIDLNHTLTELSKAAYKQLFHFEQADFEFIFQACRQLNSMASSEKDLGEIINTLSVKLSNAVFLLDPHFYIREYSIPENPAKNLSDFISFDMNHSIFHLADQKKLEKGLKEYPDNPYLDRLSYENAALSYIVVPILVGSAILSYLCVFDSHKAFSLIEFWLLEGFAPVLGVDIARRDLSLRGKANTQEGFLDYLLLNQNLGKKDLQNLCSLYGFDYKQSRICFVAEFPTLPELGFSQRRQSLMHSMELMEKELSELAFLHYLLSYKDHIVCFVTFRISDNPFGVVNRIREVLQRFYDALQPLKTDVRFGVGKVTSGVETIADGYFQAVEALQLGKRLAPDRRIFSYHENIIPHMLYSNLSRKELMDLCDNVLGPLMQLNENERELLATLEAYIENNCNLAATAKVLFIHRNTLRYRLDKVKFYLDTDEFNAKDIVKLHVALAILKLLM